MTEERRTEIRENFEKVREQIRALQPGARLLAATKTVSVEEINYAIDELNLEYVGENRVPELLEKYGDLHRVTGEGRPVEIHFIGHLQTNKVKYIIDKVDLIQSLDSLGLAAEIEKRASKIGRVMDVLVEINIGREEAKGGIDPDDVYEFLDAVAAFPHVRVVGIMTMAPKCECDAEYLKYFTETAQIFIDISQKKLHNIIEPILSMGMSGSYEAALRAGSGMIRVGSSLFGARTYPDKA